MDPDKTLEQIREEIRKLRRWMRHPSYSDHDNRLSEAEEPVEEEPTPEEELLTLSDAIAHAEEKGAGDSACAANHRQLARWLRQLEESEKAADLARERDAIRAELGAGLGDALQRTADLARAEELVDLVEALDGWLTKGGFLPKDWNK